MTENTNVNAGEVKNETATAKITLQDVLGNSELMVSLLKSEEVSKFIQSEVDKVRTKASQDLAQAKQTQDDDFAKYKAETEAKINELTIFQKNYLKNEILKKSGLEVELWDYVKGETEEEIKKSATELKKLIAKKAEETVGGKAQIGKTYTGLTKEQFGKMTYTEKAELFRTNPEIYNSLKGE